MKKSESDSLKKHNSKAASTQFPITYLCAECWIKFHIAFTLSRHNSNDFFDSSSFYLQNMQISHLARSWWIPMYFHRISCFVSSWRSAAFFIVQRLHLVNEKCISKIWIPTVANPNQNNFFTFTNLVFYRHFATFWQHIYIKWNVGNFIQLLIIFRFLRLHIHNIILFVNIIILWLICIPIVFWIKKEKNPLYNNRSKVVK